VPRSLEIGGRRVGPGEPLFVIAEIGPTRGGPLDRALALVDAAGEAGAAAITFQTVMTGPPVSAGCPVPTGVEDSTRSGQCERPIRRPGPARLRLDGGE